MKGRDVPAVEASPLKLTVKVDDLTVGDQMDLEEVTTVTDMCRWLVAHAGVTMDELRPLKMAELKALTQALAAELRDGFQVSKSNGAPSS